MSDLSRRDLLKQAALGGAVLAGSGLFTSAIAENVTAATHPDAAPPAPAARETMRGVPFDRLETVRIGIVGTGLRGRSVLSELLAIDGVRIVALADVVADKANRAAKMVTDKGQPAPAVFTNGENDFERLVARDDIDFVYTATPWEWHVPVMLAALAHGKHCGSECPIGTTLKDLWALVDASEKARRHCLHLENCNYGYNEMLVNRMVHEGVFGEVLHAEAAYLHDLRKILFEDRDEGLWRRAWHTRSNSNLYPTHGLGPVSWYLDIHAGDRYDYLVSVSSPERGLSLHREATVPDRSDPKWREKYVTGDLNTSILKTVNGKTVMLQHDVSNARPYTRHNRVMGTKGTFEDYPPRIFVEGTAGGERWGPIDEWKTKFEHPLWTEVGELARKNGGHGGMDFVMAYRLVQTMRTGVAPDYDVYDAAAWSAPLPLSEMSVAKGSAPMKFPDFTRDAWRQRPGLIAEARALLASADRIFVLTGAGISAESGVPTFRGDGGLWKSYRAEDLATAEAFARDPRLVWEWYGWRRSVVQHCSPNAAHVALARLAARHRATTLATQNVDGLHADAARGSNIDREHLIELHGSLFRVRCTACAWRAEHRDPIDAASLETLPRCARCGALARPDIVWFGEQLDPANLDRAFEDASAADVCLVVGTSAVVQPAASLATVTRQTGGAVIEINPVDTPLTSIATVAIRDTAVGALGEMWAS